jgi:hypothetical protein
VHTHLRTLTILDPTSLLGREVTERIATAWPGVRRMLFHTGGETEHIIAEVAGEAILVPPLVELDELQGSSAVVITSTPPPATGQRLIEWMRAHAEVALLDCTQPGITGGEGVSVMDRVPASGRALPWYHLIDPSLAAAARWLRALLPLDPQVFLATLLCPASGFGVEALDELASQGSARLSGQPARRPVHLPAILAFDLAPVRDERLSAIENQLVELFPAVQCGLHVVDAGVFHGTLATLQLGCAGGVSLEAARALLRATPDLRLVRRNESPTVSGSAGEGRMICGDLRVRGSWVSAWLLADGLRVGGAQAAVDVLTSLSAP